MKFRAMSLPTALALFLSLGTIMPTAFSDEHRPIDFNQDIRPILTDRCFHCHGPDAKSVEGDLRLDLEDSAKEFAISPGDVAGSDLFTRITSTDPEEHMPPEDSEKPSLTELEVALFKRWIEEGAVWANHWAWEVPKVSPIPEVDKKYTVNNPIDNFILARLNEEGLSPSPEADRATLIRRAAFDITGLPPTLEEIDQFENDTSSDAYSDMLDRLFASEHYGERMAIDWLDAARYADTNGFQNDFNRDMHIWRDWVIDAFNANMPFDQFTIEQLAGDMLPDATQSQRIATGFNRNHRSNTEGGSIEAEWRIENIVDRVETTGAVYLGLTLGCARCHDHKYDPFSQKDFYRFFSFFNHTKEKGFYEETRGNAGILISLPNDAQAEKQAQFDRAVIAVKELFEASEKDITQRYEQAATTPNDSESPPDAKPDAKKKKEIKTARTALTALEKDQKEFLKEIPSVMVMEEREEPRKTYRLERGAYDAPDTSEELFSEVPEFLHAIPEGTPKNRLGLAQWLVAEENPLTARVTVNRLWYKFFGQGIVSTLDNFGTQGAVPTHPELLDWLALELIRLDWDLKAFQKSIMMCATYRQNSNLRPELIQQDPNNLLLARGPRFRLNAELIRDNALAASGLLVRDIGGGAVKPYQPEGMWEELAGGASEGPYKIGEGNDIYRRSLYTVRKRTVPHATLSTFDAPSFEICQVKRARTNTPLQALALLNDTTYVEAARHLAQRMITEGGDQPEQRIAHGFRLTTGRPPSERELSIMTQGYTGYVERFTNNTEQAQAFLSNGKSTPDETLDTTQLAAYSAIASVMLNLDETITKE